MLKKLQEPDFEQYVDFAYQLALDMTKSGYPTYADGIKTKDDFVACARKAFSIDNEEILLYEQDGKMAGWIHYFYLPEDHYLDTCAFCIASGMKEALIEFIAFAQEHFPGSELYLGFPRENTEAVAALEAQNFDCIEESYNDAMDFEDYVLQPEDAGILPITRENYELFSDLHSQNDGDMYWNSARILDAIDRWQVYVCIRNGRAEGAIYYMHDTLMPEIFGVDFPDDIYNRDVYRVLLIAALNDCKRRGAKHMTFFNEGESQTDAVACGFRCIGEYMCFKKVL
ncbi:MAG: hypothetical protein K2N94_14175 [Lachnospiraceae bacterium]|nr:hypothetical protein [Lachnospiraceae bacterium]